MVSMDSSAVWNAELTDGASAIVHEARVLIEAPDIVIQCPDGKLLDRWNLKLIDVDRSQNGVVLVSRGDALLTVFTPESAPRFELPDRPGGARPLAISQRLALYGLATAAVITVAWLLLPTLSSLVARRVPLHWERALGGSFTDLMIKSSCGTPQAKAALEQIKAKLIKSYSPKDPKERELLQGLEFQIHILPDPNINAFALPGGVILMTSGFLKSSSSPEEVAAVLAHEIQHVLQRHVMTQLVRSSILTFFWSVALGDYTGFLVVDPSTAYQLALLKFNREDETRADQGAVAMLDQAGISRRGFKTFFERTRTREKPWLGMISTHPSNAYRIQLLEQIQPDPRGNGSRNSVPDLLSVAETKALWAPCP